MGIPSVCFPLIIPGPVISCPPIIRISLPSGRLCRRGLCLNGTPKKAQKALGFSGRNVPQNGRFGTVCPTWGKLYRLVISMRLTRTALKINLYAQRLRRGTGSRLRFLAGLPILRIWTSSSELETISALPR